VKMAVCPGPEAVEKLESYSLSYGEGFLHLGLIWIIEMVRRVVAYTDCELGR